MRPIAAPLGLLALILGACGGDDEQTSTAPRGYDAAGERYPAPVRDAFLAACERSSDGETEACRCALEKLEATMSFEEFKIAESAIARGEKGDYAGRRKITEAMAECTQNDEGPAPADPSSSVS